MRSILIPLVVVALSIVGCTQQKSERSGHPVDQTWVEASVAIPPPPVPNNVDISVYMDDPQREGPSYGREFTTRDRRTGATVQVFPDNSFIATLPGNKGTFGRRLLSNESRARRALAFEVIGRGVQAPGVRTADSTTSVRTIEFWKAWHYWDDRKIDEGRREWHVTIPSDK